MRVELISVDTWTAERRIVLQQLPVLVGRSSEADVRIQDRWASRRHCQIDLVEEALVVRDLGSKHGTYVNGQQVSEARLLPGDKLSVGMNSFRVEYQSSSADAECETLTRF